MRSISQGNDYMAWEYFYLGDAWVGVAQRRDRLAAPRPIAKVLRDRTCTRTLISVGSRLPRLSELKIAPRPI